MSAGSQPPRNQKCSPAVCPYCLAGGTGRPGFSAGLAGLPQPSSGLTKALTVGPHVAYCLTGHLITREWLNFSHQASGPAGHRNAIKSTLRTESQSVLPPLPSESISLRYQERIQRACQVAGMRLLFSDHCGLIVKAPQLWRLSVSHSEAPEDGRGHSSPSPDQPCYRNLIEMLLVPPLGLLA